MTSEKHAVLSADERTLAEFAADNPIALYQPWSKQDEFHRADYTIRLLAWANRCGKTTTGAAECVLAGMGWHSAIEYPAPPFTIWAVGVDYKQMRDAIIPAFEGDSTHPRMLPRGVTLNEQKMQYVLPSGSIIRLKSSDSGCDSFQGAAVPLIWLDEDQPVPVLREIFARIGPGFKRRIVWTMTPVKGLTYAYDAFYVPWEKAITEGRDHPDIFCSVAAMDDNPHLDASEIAKLAALYPAHSKEYKVRRYGGFEDLAGDSLFSDEVIERHTASICPPRRTVYLECDDDGEIIDRDHLPADAWACAVWRGPVDGQHYAVGVDVAEGRVSDKADVESKRDYSVAVVFDRQTGEIAARLRTQIEAHAFGRAVWLLGKWYNDAWVCHEVNNAGISVSSVLRGDQSLPTYPNIFQRDKAHDEWVDEQTDLLGWRTTTVTRPILINDLYTAIKDGSITIYDDLLLAEMKTFQRNKEGKIEHQRGKHDDIIFATGLALQAHQRCPLGVAIVADTAGESEPDHRDYNRMLIGGREIMDPSLYEPDNEDEWDE